MGVWEYECMSMGPVEEIQVLDHGTGLGRINEALAVSLTSKLLERIQNETCTMCVLCGL